VPDVPTSPLLPSTQLVTSTPLVLTRTSTINSRYAAIVDNSTLLLGGTHRITYTMDSDMLWSNVALPTHPNGMRFSVFDSAGDLLATNEYFSVGGGFVVNQRTQVDENLFYRAINKKEAAPARRDQTHGVQIDVPQLAPPQEDSSGSGEGEGAAKKEDKQPPFLFHNAQSLESLTRKHNVPLILSSSSLKTSVSVLTSRHGFLLQLTIAQVWVFRAP
jgi:hypothetical protein